ncbi:MAG: response regulator [Candidatus Eremiobacteraeota bacterium]|nr:response regulator [Candidatus Eremiobacteraeota bacterium]
MGRILVVEDDESMNEILVSTLSDAGHEVKSVFNGEEAVNLCQEVWFDLVITDVRLPGIDGVETLSRLKDIQFALKFIVITGYASEDTPVRAIRLSVDDYLFKPFSLRYLLESVERVLNQEEDKKSKLDLFEALFSEVGLTPAEDSHKLLESLVDARQEAFRGLYVGIRSGYLSQTKAAEIYTDLEALEDAFRNELHVIEKDKSNALKLQAHYSDIHQRLALLKSGDQVGTKPRIPARLFQPLFDAVKKSAITFEELLYAPLLRKTPEERFEALTELLALKRKLWPDSK